MAMLVGPLMDVKDPGKIRNRRVAKSRIGLIPILFILTLLIVKVNNIRIATKKWPLHWIYYASIDYMSVKGRVRCL